MGNDEICEVVRDLENGSNLLPFAAEFATSLGRLRLYTTRVQVQ